MYIHHEHRYAEIPSTLWKEGSCPKRSKPLATCRCCHSGTCSLRSGCRLAHLPCETKTNVFYLHGYIIFFFLRNTVQTQALIYTRIHSPLWTHTRTPYLYEHLRKTESADRVLRLTKSPRAPRYRREHRLPLKEYSAFMRHTDVKPGVWTLAGWGYNHPPNHPTSGWFSCTVT
jgi:hypothetical protein